jgi:hypothetical protein
MRAISPSEMTDFTFCQKYWYNKRHLEMVPIKIGYRDLAAYMGVTVGWSIDQSIKGIEHDARGYFHTLLEDQLALGREYDFGVEDYMEKYQIDVLVDTHIRNVWDNQETWLQGGEIIASEPVMMEWGQARQDLILKDTQGLGVVLDFKCKLKADSDKFPISRDIDTYGNQRHLYPLAWDSQSDLKIKTVRFVYIQEGRQPIVEDCIVEPRRQARWLQAYQNVCESIEEYEKEIDLIPYDLTENPYHMTPWGYPCEFRDYCMSGENPQGALGQFIQVERKPK